MMGSGWFVVRARSKCISTEIMFSRNTSIQSTKDTTVNESEVDSFSKLKNAWWDRNGSMKPLHAMNQIRVPLVRDGLLGKSNTNTPVPLVGKKILDIGCGGGILSEPLARLGADVTGVDASSELISLAKDHSKLDPKLVKNKPTYICTTIEEHSKSSKDYYDAVVASETIEHITNKELFVQSCIITLKPGGSIFFTTPSRTFLSWLGGIFLAENIFRVIPKGTHEYENFTTPTELSYLVEKNNCRVKAIYGAFYNLWCNSWTFTSTQQFMFILHAMKMEEK